MQKYKTNYLLWAISFWPVLIAIGFFDFGPSPDNSGLWRNIYRLSTIGGSAQLIGVVALQIVVIVPISAFVSWALQAISVVCMRRPRPFDNQEAENYR